MKIINFGKLYHKVGIIRFQVANSQPIFQMFISYVQYLLVDKDKS